MPLVDILYRRDCRETSGVCHKRVVRVIRLGRRSEETGLINTPTLPHNGCEIPFALARGSLALVLSKSCALLV